MGATEQPDPDECKANQYGGPEDCGCDLCRELVAEENYNDV
ncbi:hypothetical protein [Streptomyces sp. SS07]|nr:hypothetical protein [Streptomyces sp. SS07]